MIIIVSINRSNSEYMATNYPKSYRKFLVPEYHTL